LNGEEVSEIATSDQDLVSFDFGGQRARRKPPQDHPHIYLKMVDASEIVCPYSTLFRFDPSLGAREPDPADCAYGDED
jgi:hypothetical protein